MLHYNVLVAMQEVDPDISAGHIPLWLLSERASLRTTFSTAIAR